MNKETFDEQLQKHLWKAELDFRAKHQKEPCCIDWLAPHCNSLSKVYHFLKSLGYRDLEMISDSTDGGSEWVISKHFCVFVNKPWSMGFFSPRS